MHLSCNNKFNEFLPFQLSMSPDLHEELGVYD